MIQNGVKPRFDGKGTEFGKMHRWVGKEYGMTDIDYCDMSSIIEVFNKCIETRIDPYTENKLFIEYKTIWSKTMTETHKPKYNAIFDLKYDFSQNVHDKIKCKVSTSIWLQYEMAKTLQSRFFIVYENKGIQPFDFFEFKDRNKLEYVGTLSYHDDKDGPAKAIDFWKNFLKL